MPREVLRKMGAARPARPDAIAEQYGGGGADALTNLVFAEALVRSRPSAASSITVLVHTDMASPAPVPRRHARRRWRRYLPEVIARRTHHRGRRHRARRGSDVPAIRTRAAARRRRLGAQRHARCSSPTACTPTCTSSPRAPTASARAPTGSRCSSSRRARRAFASAARSTRPGWLSLRHRRAGVRGLPHSRRRTCSARRTRASTRS